MTLGISFSSFVKCMIVESQETSSVKSFYDRVTEERGETEGQGNSFYLTVIPQLSSFLQVVSPFIINIVNHHRCILNEDLSHRDSTVLISAIRFNFNYWLRKCHDACLKNCLGKNFDKTEMDFKPSKNTPILERSLGFGNLFLRQCSFFFLCKSQI